MKYCLLISLVLTLSGCGVARFNEETYTAGSYLIHSNESDKVWLFVASTNSTKSIFPFYYSSKKSGPYSIYLKAHSHAGQNESLNIDHVLVKLSESTLIEPKIPTKALRFTTPNKDSTHSEGSVSISLGESLMFIDKEDIEVCIYFTMKMKKISACNAYRGIKYEHTGSNFDIYMSV